MKLLCLGTTGYHPNNIRHTACYMLPELGIVLDAGTGMFRVRDHLKTDSLDIFITHAHLDHVVGLTFLLDVLFERDVTVRVHADSRHIAEIESHLFAPALFPVKPTFKWVPFDAPVPLREGGMASFFPLEHPGGSTGFRFDWPDRSVAYVTDTTADLSKGYLKHLNNLDLLVHECYFPDKFESLAELTGHSCVTPVAKVAQAVNPKQLLLIHLAPLTHDIDPVGLDVAKSIFPHSILATDGLEVEF